MLDSAQSSPSITTTAPNTLIFGSNGDVHNNAPYWTPQSGAGWTKGIDTGGAATSGTAIAVQSQIATSTVTIASAGTLAAAATNDKNLVVSYRVATGGGGTSYTDRGLSAGTYYYAVAAEDAAGNVSAPSTQANATATADMTPPAVSLTAPAAGATVSGSVPVSATASDNVGVVGVQFKLDGANLGAEQTSSPYSVSWNTASATNGTHNLTAVARDAAGNSTTSAAVTVTVSNTGPSVLLGDQSIETAVDFNSAGQAEAFKTTATGTGSMNKLSFYLDATSAAASVTVGLYADNAGSPGSLLGQATLSSPAKGAWNSVTLATPVSVTGGTAYWIALLGPTGTGTIQFRDHGNGTGSVASTSTQTNLTSLPSTWTSGGSYFDGPVSAYGAQAGAVAPPDTTPPTTPGNVRVTGGIGKAELAWNASTDNVGVVKYDVYRSTTAGFTPSASNRIAQPTGLSYSDVGLAAGTYYYAVAAEDAAGNVSTPSALVSATVTADTTPPTVSLTAPQTNATVSGIVTVSATASDNVGVASVQFQLDGTNLSSAQTIAPYSIQWDTTSAANGSHTLTAIAKDAAGNAATSSPVAVTTSNATPTFLFGDKTIEPNLDSNSAGQAEAFRMIASASGALGKLTFYLDSTSAATSVIVGVYSDNVGRAGALLGQATLPTPTKGAWNTVTMPSGVSISSGTAYWMAILGPVGAGTVQFRDKGNGTGTPASVSSQTTLTTLPTSWTSGGTWNDGTISGWGS